MSKYIDADKLLREAEKLGFVESTTISVLVEKIPAAEDVVQVVRCRDCKHSKPLDLFAEVDSSKLEHCKKWHGKKARIRHRYSKNIRSYSLVAPDDYCSYGERKEAQ